MTEYLMHYIGSGLYKQEVFEREVKRIGVQRAIGFGMLGSLEFGQPILLARFNGKASSSAEVFGYFVVNGVTHNLPRGLCEKLYHHLDIVVIQDGGGSMESRACGSYSVGSVAIIRDSLETLIKEIKELLAAAKLSPNKFKWFVKGRYVPFETSIMLTSATFSRGFKRVEIEDLDLAKQQVRSKKLLGIQDYDKKRHLSKKRSAAMNSHKLTDFNGAMK